MVIAKPDVNAHVNPIDIAKTKKKGENFKNLTKKNWDKDQGVKKIIKIYRMTKKDVDMYIFKVTETTKE